MFVVYDGDGVIDQTVIGPDESYGAILDQAGHEWLFLDGVASLDIRLVHVDRADRTVKPNAAMSLQASRASIAADGVDVARISGVPTGAVVQIFCADKLLSVETVTDGEIEFAAAAPALYRFLVTAKRYLPGSIEIVAL